MSPKRVALALGVAALAVGGAAATGAVGGQPERPAQHFRTRPDLRPPPVEVLTRTRGTTPGYVFIAPKRAVAQPGPMIVDDAGNTVWFRPLLDTGGVADFRVQRYRGRPVLTYWRGSAEMGIGVGHYVILDESYRVVKRVLAGNELVGDIHEFVITPGNTALITIYHRRPWDLSGLGGRRNEVQEGVVQEIDISTGRVVFEWRSGDHVDPSESYSPLPRSVPYDYFHINSVAEDRDGSLIVSARNTHAIYKISRDDGSVLWRLGGKMSDFAMGPGTTFAWQHDARPQPDGTLTLFDNEAAPEIGDRSRVLVLDLDEQTSKATLVRSYTHPEALLSGSQGNAQFLQNGNVFVGWGANPYYTEFDREGRVLLDARFGSGADSYRAYRSAWSGRPLDRPALAVIAPRSDRLTLYASWNGATTLARWRVLAGNDRDRLRPILTVPAAGFETRIPLDTRPPFVAVQALDRAGTLLRASGTVATGGSRGRSS